MSRTLFDDIPSKQELKELQDRVAKVIKPLIPSDAADRVERAVKQWNQLAREHIRNETGLRLSEGEGRSAIPVRVADGFPISLAELIDSYQDPLVWVITLGQPRFGGAVSGLGFLLEQWAALENWPKLPVEAKGARPALERSLEVAQILQNLAIADDARERIRKIDEDILGVYRFGRGSPVIELYWLPIAMMSAMLDVRIEDLALVVMVHELAHGYTHLGRDIDGMQWSQIGFANSAIAVVEGLAQFYTAVVTEKLSQRAPAAHDAYKKLLKMQSGPYLAHLEWIKSDRHRSGEAVRYALVARRQSGAVTTDAWASALAEARKTLR